MTALLRKKKAKKVKVELIERYEIPGDDSSDETEPWRLLAFAVEEWHADRLKEARIALVWKIGLQPNKDGILELGKAKKISDAERELAKDFDLVIFLNKEAWADMKPKQRVAIIDHELCHFTVDFGEDGEPKKDERDRIIYRIHKHDLEEFRDVVARHGLYKADIEEFARTCALRQGSFFKG